jgi:hypothetical protein
MTESYSVDLRKPADRELWLELRRRDITASDVAAICGVHPKRTPMTVYAQKLGKLETGDSNIMRRGRWMEPAIIAALADERPDLTVWQPRSYIRDSELRIGATLDFSANDRDGKHWIIEGKIVAKPEFLKHWVDVFEDRGGLVSGAVAKAPLWYELQALTQAKLRKADRAMIAALIVDTYSADLEPIDVPIVDSAWDVVKTRVADFWARFDAGEMPDLNPALDAEALDALYPSDDGAALDLSGDPEAAGLVMEWDSLASHIKAVDAAQQPNADRIKEIKTELQAKFGNAAVIRLPGWQVTYKTQHRKAIDATSFRVMRRKRLSASPKYTAADIERIREIT